MSHPDRTAEFEPIVRQFARLVRAVATKVGEADGRTIDADAEQQVYHHLLQQLDGQSSNEAVAAVLYRHAVRETVRLLGPKPGSTQAGHVDAALWDQLAINDIAGSDRERGLQHAQSCPDRARVWHGVSTLKEEAEARKLIAASANGRPWWRAPLVLVIVAVLIGIAVAAFFITLQTDS
jgi:hypothetical protein